MKNTKKNTIKTSKPNRSAAALKAWETRRKNKAVTTGATKPEQRLLADFDHISGAVTVTYTGSIGDPLTTKLITLLNLG